MVLDYVLTLPDAEWYATEEDKVAPVHARAGDSPRRLAAARVRPHGPAQPADDAVFHSQAAGLPHGRSGRRPLRVSRERRDRPRARAVSSGPRATVQRVAGVVRRGRLPTRAERLGRVPNRLRPVRRDDVAAGAARRHRRRAVVLRDATARRGRRSAEPVRRGPGPVPRGASAVRERAAWRRCTARWLAHGERALAARERPRASSPAPAAQLVTHGIAVDVQPVRIVAGGVLMGPAASECLVAPLLAPLLAPTFASRRETSAPEARPQSPWETMTLCRADVLGDAALFAASGVKSRVTGEGGATPSNSRGLDPAPRGAGRPAGVAPPSPVTTEPDRATARPAIRL